ncbi:hypothetical protein VKT23_015238 [Stygiomarasmius scandens]|uniref:Uncharacterized protein n=1 Tax=Marasmiellus scandens TaxID=2682957 RepID=A0ABR1IYE3_9AGAR
MTVPAHTTATVPLSSIPTIRHNPSQKDNGASRVAVLTTAAGNIVGGRHAIRTEQNKRWEDQRATRKVAGKSLQSIASVIRQLDCYHHQPCPSNLPSASSSAPFKPSSRVSYHRPLTTEPTPNYPRLLLTVKSTSLPSQTELVASFINSFIPSLLSQLPLNYTNLRLYFESAEGQVNVCYFRCQQGSAQGLIPQSSFLCSVIRSGLGFVSLFLRVGPLCARTPYQVFLAGLCGIPKERQMWRIGLFRH